MSPGLPDGLRVSNPTGTAGIPMHRFGLLLLKLDPPTFELIQKFRGFLELRQRA